MSVTNPNLDDHLRWICNTSTDDGKNSIQSLIRERAKHTDPFLLEVFEKAMAMEIRTSHRKSLIVALRSAIKQVTPKNPPATLVTAVIVPAPVAILGDASKALEKLRVVIGKHEESFHAQTLGPRLQIGLQCLKAYQVFVVPEPGKRNKSGKNQHSKTGQLTRELASEGGFKGWLADEAPWLKEPTAYKYMTAVRGLALDHSATEKQVAAALKLRLRQGPVTIKSLCDAAVEAVGPPPPPPELLQQSEFQFLREGIKDFREHAEQLLALKDQLQANPDMHRVVCARAYDILFQLTGTNWAPSDEPDALALVDPDSITL